jgi:hypothetical protein
MTKIKKHWVRSLEQSKDQDILIEQLGSQEKKKQTGPIADLTSSLLWSAPDSQGSPAYLMATTRE